MAIQRDVCARSRSALVGECRAEKKYYLANVPAQTDSRTLALQSGHDASRRTSS